MHIARLSTGAATAVAATVQLLAYSAGHAGAFQVVGNAAAPAASAVSVASGGARFAAPHVVKTHHRHHHHHNVNSNSNANAITSSYSMAARPTALHFSSNNYNPSYRGNSSCSNDNNSRRSGEISRSAFCSRAPTPPPPPTTQTTAAAAQSPAAYRALSSSSFSSPPRRPSGGERGGRATGRLSMMASGGGGAGGKGDGGGDKGGKGQGGRGKKGESVQNRALATVVYLLPMLDGIECGENVFRVVPQLGGAVHTVLAPALAVWDNVPFLPIVMFIILQVSVRRQNTSRFIRFNIQQAILVDILTVVLGLLGTAVGTLVPEGEQFLTNFSFYCLAAAVAYAVGETARGRVANQIPLISAAAEIQLGPS